METLGQLTRRATFINLIWIKLILIIDAQSMAKIRVVIDWYRFSMPEILLAEKSPSVEPLESLSKGPAVHSSLETATGRNTLHYDWQVNRVKNSGITNTISKGWLRLESFRKRKLLSISEFWKGCSFYGTKFPHALLPEKISPLEVLAWTLLTGDVVLVLFLSLHF